MRQAESEGPDGGFDRHGGRLDEAARAFPGAATPWIDLSTGINPVPWRPPAGLRVDSAPLPTTAALRTLEGAAARHFGVTPSSVAAVPGSEVALRLLPALGLPMPIVAAAPGYGSHAAVAQGTVARGEVASAPAGTILLANPNNPDGDMLSPADLSAMAARRADRGGMLVIDEAFADAVPAACVLPAWDGRSPLVVLRSFGKFFGLAGVRLGFVVAPEPVVGRVRRLFGDWPVGAQAIAWGTTAYADRDWIAATRRSLTDKADRLDAVLDRHGLSAAGACPLFRLVEHPDARAVFVRLARAGILTRPFAGRPDWLRFGLPADDDAFDRLDRALADG